MTRLLSILFSSVLTLAAASHAFAAELPSSTPEAQGFSSSRLKRLDDYMLGAVERGVMVGGQAVIARRGTLVFNETWGDSDREAGTPMTRDALYRIYSMSKPITGVALMMLYEQGRFLLSDPVARYLPELSDLRVVDAEAEDGTPRLRAPARQPTIRDLLRHTAGFSYGVFGDTPVDRAYREADLLRQPDLQSFVATLGQQPLLFDPGSRWHYSVAVDVQGRLIEVLSGQSFGEFLKEHLFEPLGMNDTFFVVPEDKRERLAQLYTPEGAYMSWDKPWVMDGRGPLQVADPEISRPYLEGNLFESGGGGLVSSARDYLRFAQMLLNGGELDGVRILGPLTVEHMHRDHLGAIARPTLYTADTFGLGVSVVLDPALRGELIGEGSYGWAGAAGTHFWIDPSNEVIGLFMTQSIPHLTDLAEKFKVLTYQALLEPGNGS